MLTISPLAFFIFLSWRRKYQKRDLATTSFGAKMRIRYNFGVGSTSVGRWRPITWYSVNRDMGEGLWNEDVLKLVQELHRWVASKVGIIHPASISWQDSQKHEKDAGTSWMVERVCLDAYYTHINAVKDVSKFRINSIQWGQITSITRRRRLNWTLCEASSNTLSTLCTS